MFGIVFYKKKIVLSVRDKNFVKSVDFILIINTHYSVMSIVNLKSIIMDDKNKNNGGSDMFLDDVHNQQQGNKDKNSEFTECR